MLYPDAIRIRFSKGWLLHDTENRRLLIITTIVSILQFSIFKYLYPFPNFMPPDSNSYLEAAYNNQIINMWPIGYSMFLRLVSSFTNSHFILVIIQYIILQASVIYFLFTFSYILKPSKWLFRVLLFVLILNPLTLHISNFVSSDSLFISLSLVWFTQLLWVLYQPNKYLFVLHAIILLIAFMVRYYALYYPLISIGCIIGSKILSRQKIASISLIIILLATFIVRTIVQYNYSIGTPQFSAFGGWQIAANALYGYAHVKKEPVETVPHRFRELHGIVNTHMNSLNQLLIRPDQYIGVYYLWDEKAPLKQYMHYSWRNNDSTRFFKRWASMGPLYGAYGRYLISKYPISFAKHFLWPNLIKFYAPPPGFLGEYNIGKSTVDEISVSWFGWKNNKVSTFSNNNKIVISSFFQILAAVQNLFFILSFIFFTAMGGFKNISKEVRKIVWLMIITWLSNLVFSVTTAPIELRYQIFQLSISLCFITFFIFYVLKINGLHKTESFKTNELLITR